jgi:hypothetical protein
MCMKPVNETTLPNHEPVGVVETLLGIGELIAAVFAMQPGNSARQDVSRRELAPIRVHDGALDADARRTLKDAVAEFNEKL